MFKFKLVLGLEKLFEAYVTYDNLISRKADRTYSIKYY